MTREQTTAERRKVQRPAVDENRKLNVVVFSGGRGTHSLTETLLRHRQLRLTVIINAYDDGLSTGRLRKYIPGLLGPSDVRKNISRMMANTDASHRALQTLSDLRFPIDTSYEGGCLLVNSLAKLDDVSLPEDIGKCLRNLALAKARSLAGFFAAFQTYSNSRAEQGEHFDFADCAVGNLIFAGCYLMEQRDFNSTVKVLSDLYGLRGKLLNVTAGENLFLMAQTESGAFLESEAEIVSQASPDGISNLFLISESAYRSVEALGAMTAERAAVLTQESSQIPRLNPEAKRAIEEADIIIYGAGTQHSSLFPSYLTLGFAEAVAANETADKIFLGNIVRDVDIERDDVTSLIRKFMQFANRYGQCSFDSRKLITHFFLQDAGPSSSSGKYLAFNRDAFDYGLDRVRIANWESDDGKHAGGRLLDEILAIVESRIYVSLKRVHREVSIVVPVLNEATTLARVLTDLQALDLSDLDLNKEIVVVDGGSKDDSVRIARSFRGIRVLQLPGEGGKGEAMRMGIEKSVGNIVVFFPADEEYDCREIRTLVMGIAKDGYKAVFGSRAIKCMNLNNRIRDIYGNSTSLLLVSKYGGMMLSVITLVLFNRYVADVLTSVKAFDRNLLNRFVLKCKSFDIEAELVAETALAGEYILELPVNFKPRQRSDGKKIRLTDGIGCMRVLLTRRIAAGRPG